MSAKPLLSPGEVFAPVIGWLSTHAHGLFRAMADAVEAVLGAAGAMLPALPAPVMAAAVVAPVWWRQGVRMYARSVEDAETGMATVETLAHLAHLRHRGEVGAAPDKDGALRFRSV